MTMISLPTTTYIRSAATESNVNATYNTTYTTESFTPTEDASTNATTAATPVVTIVVTPIEAELFRVLRIVASRFNNTSAAVATASIADATTGCSVSTTATTNENIGTRDDDGTTDTSAQPTEPLVIRVAGGWVRDKILASNSSSNSSSNSNSESSTATTATTAADIDITTNRISGVQLATLLHDYLVNQYQDDDDNNDDDVSFPNKNQNTHDTEHETNPTRFRLSCTGRVGIIAANPTQSKHLETATMHISGVSLDLCPLRGHETYTTKSRIPQGFVPGTPHDDAMRRDFTINALFYNLHTGQIEDWTQRGYTDLITRHPRRLVTPLDPLTTFLDDPLRVLRAIRFAVRYQCCMDPALMRAAQQTVLHQALTTKVSRERVGKELEGMVSGTNAQPFRALAVLSELNLASSVFTMPMVGVHCATLTGPLLGQEVHWDQEDCNHTASTNGTVTNAKDGDHDDRLQELLVQQAWNEASRLLPLAQSVWDAHVAQSGMEESSPFVSSMIDQSATRTTTSTTTSTTTQPSLRLLALASFLLPFRKLIGTDLVKQHARQMATVKTWSVVTFMAKESIKCKNIDVAAFTTMMSMVDAVTEFLSLYNGTTNATTTSWSRLDAGLLVRQAKELWVTVFLLATVALLGQQSSDPDTNNNNKNNGNNNRVDWIQVGAEACAYIIRLGLDECWKVRPLLDGKSLIAALSLSKGPTVGVYMDEQVRWMLSHPGGTVDDCILHLQQMPAIQSSDDDESAKRGDKRKQNAE